MLTCPASIPLSTRSLTRLTELIRNRRRALGARWRRLPAQQQAPMALAYLRNGDTLTRLAAGFEVSVATVWRYLREAVGLLAACAGDLAAAMRRASRLAYAILDGTLIPIDRVADQRPYYSGKHKRHGVNVQVLADAAGRLVWASAALPGSVHDLTAARTHGLIDGLTNNNVLTFADKGYQGAGGTLWTPFKRRRTRLSRRQKQVNRHHAKIRALGERAVSTLKTWKNSDQATLLPPPGHPDRSGHPRPPNRRRRPPPTMKMAH